MWVQQYRGASTYTGAITLDQVYDAQENLRVNLCIYPHNTFSICITIKKTKRKGYDGPFLFFVLTQLVEQVVVSHCNAYSNNSKYIYTTYIQYKRYKRCSFRITFNYYLHSLILKIDIRNNFIRQIEDDVLCSRYTFLRTYISCVICNLHYLLRNQRKKKHLEILE